MKTKDELKMLKEWIAEQREIYNNSNFENDDKKLDAIKRQLVLQEITLQIMVFEKLTSDAVIDSWSKKIDIGISGSTHTIGNQVIMIGSTNDTPESYMHVSPDLRKQLDKASQNKIVKS